jgi:cytochrome P450
MNATVAPGPKPTLLDSLTYRPGRNPLAYYTNLARTYGDVASFRMAGEQLFLVSDPQLIKDVLVTNNRNFTKSRGLQRTKRLLGEGLLTSEGATHLRQRRLMQPAFHRERIAAYADTMIAYADRTRRAWRDGATLDVAQEMNRLTLSIVGKTLFDKDVESQAAEVGVALTGVMETFWMTMLPFAELLEHLPVPKLRRARLTRPARRDYLRHDRGAPQERPRSRRPALDAALGAGSAFAR